jgi:hypothetical protein
MHLRDHLPTHRQRAGAWASDGRRRAHTAAAPRVLGGQAFRPLAGTVRARNGEDAQGRPVAALPAGLAGPRLPHAAHAAHLQCHSQAGMATANPPTAGTRCHEPSTTAKTDHTQG